MNITLNEEDRSEILRYLGYRGSEITEVVENKLKEAVLLANRIIDPKMVWKLFSTEKTGEGLSLKETDFVLKGESINKHLEGYDRVILFCVTLGLEFDREVEKQMVKDPTLAVILNAAGIQAIEKCADFVQKEAEEELKGRTGQRFSPGYGDFSLDNQKDFVRLLDTERRVGVRLNRNDLMSPLKSVTAVCGIRGE